jgi:hypothetical protein
MRDEVRGSSCAFLEAKMRRKTIAAVLQGGDRRSLGKANQIAKLVLSEPHRFAELIQRLWDEDPIVRMRAADAAEKVTVTRPELLKPHKTGIAGAAGGSRAD